MSKRLIRLMAFHFPFLKGEEISDILSICARSNGLTYFPLDKPEALVGYFRFYPELIEAVQQQDFDLLEECDLSYGPLVYLAALILPEGERYAEMREIARVLNAKAYCFHRFRHGEWRFHFFKNSVFSKRGQNASVH